MSLVDPALRSELLRLAVALFDAAPSAATLSLLEQRVAAGASVAQLAGLIAGPAGALAGADAALLGLNQAFAARHPASQPQAQYLDAFLGTFGLRDDAVARAAVAALLDSPGVNRGDVAYVAQQFLSAVSEPPWAQAHRTLLNKAEAAGRFAEASGPANRLDPAYAPALGEVLQAVGAEAASIALADAPIAALVQQAQAAQDEDLLGLSVLMLRLSPGASRLEEFRAQVGALGSVAAFAPWLEGSEVFGQVNPAGQTSAQAAAAMLGAIGLQDNALASGFALGALEAGMGRGALAQLLLGFFTGADDAGFAAQVAGLPADDRAALLAARGTLLNKVEVAAYHSVQRAGEAPDLASAQALLAGVDAGAASVAEAIEAVDALLNRAPQLAGGASQSRVLAEDAGASALSLVASDADGDALSITVTALPDAAIVRVLLADGATPLAAGQVLDAQELAGLLVRPLAEANGDAGRLGLRIADRYAALEASVAIAVTPVNDAPELAQPLAQRTVVAGRAVEWTVAPQTFADRDADALALAATLADGSPLPAWLSFDAGAGRFAGTPAAGDVGTLSVRLAASDGQASASGVFELNVVEPFAVVFAASTAASGRELWVTDGTAAGTSLVKDIAAGTADSWPNGLLALGDGRVLFAATSAASGVEPWISDGTAAGTRMLAELNPGSSGSFPYHFTALGDGVVVFRAQDGANGTELWSYDASGGGAPERISLRPGTASGAVGSSMAALGDGRAVFDANDGVSGSEPWVTDGTPAGTFRLADIALGLTGADPSGFALLRAGVALFSAHAGNSIDRELYVTDGTVAGTRLVRNISADIGSSPSNITALGDGRAVFSASINGPAGTGRELFVTDGTEAGTQLVKDIVPGASGSGPANFFAFPDGRVLFTADQGGGGGNRLWITDGTTANTRPVFDGDDPLANANSFEGMADGRALFVANKSGLPILWVTDGTAGGTRPVSDLAVYSPVNDALVSRVPLPNGEVLIAGSDGEFGHEPWMIDASASGVRLVADVETAPAAQFNLLASPASDFAAMGDGRVLLRGYEAASGFEPWISDGTEAGTSLLRNLRPDDGYFGDSLGMVALYDVRPGPDFTALGGGRFLFSADDGVHGQELWFTDGTAAGTRMLADLFPGGPFDRSMPSELTRLGDDLVLFFADDGVHGFEPWVSDGTAAGTRLLQDVRTGFFGSSPLGAIALGDGRAMFRATDDANGNRLWVTDGTPAGTLALPQPAIPIGLPVSLGDGRAAFAATGAGSSDSEPWISDGTPAGTRLLKDVQSGSGSSFPSGFAALGGGRFLFSANSGASGAELWVSDGTEAGTQLLKDIRPGASASFPSGLTPFIVAGGQHRVLFAANDGSSGSEPWISDGTAAGTTRLTQVAPGSAGSSPSDFVDLGNGRALFGASDGLSGREPWVTDGTAAGTFLLMDVNAGAGESRPGGFVAIGGGRAVFNAWTPDLGMQPYVTDGTPEGTRMLASFPSIGAGSNPDGLTLIGMPP